MFVCRKYRTIFFSFFAFFSYLLRFMMTIVPPLSALWIMISWLDCKFLMVSFSCTVMFCWWLVYFLLPKLIIPFFTYEIYWLCFYWWNILIVFLPMKYIDCVYHSGLVLGKMSGFQVVWFGHIRSFLCFIIYRVVIVVCSSVLRKNVSS